MDLEELDEDELEALAEQIEAEQATRKLNIREIQKMGNRELEELSAEVHTKIKQKKRKGRVNSDPIVEFE